MARRCIYCKSRSGSFTAKEHIVPESFGNSELLLPKGVVCDACNNGPLARLDAAFLDFFPIAVMRAMMAIPNKKGRRKTLNLPGLILKPRRDGGLRVIDVAGAAVEKKGPAHLVVNTQSKRPIDTAQARQVARAMVKQMLGLAFIDHGRKFTLQSGLDPLRDIVMEDRPFDGTLVLPNGARFEASSRVIIQYDYLDELGRPPLYVAATYYGVEMLTLVGVEDGLLVHPPPDFTTRFDLSVPDSADPASATTSR